jgi:hypothetical protein
LEARFAHRRRSTVPELFRAFLSIAKLDALQRSSLFITELLALPCPAFPVDELDAYL